MPETYVPQFDPKYVGDSRIYSFDFSNFPEVFTESGGTCVITVEAGGGALTLGSSSYNTVTKIGQCRVSAGAANTTYTLKASLTTSPNAYIFDGFATLPVIPNPS